MPVDDEAANNLDDTQGLRIAAVFIILIGGLLGGVPTLFFQGFRDNTNNITLLVRSFSAGIIVSLAFVHICTEAFEQWGEVVPDYPVGPCTVLAGLVFMIILENAAHAFFESHSSSMHLHRHDSSSDHGHDAKHHEHVLSPKPGHGSGHSVNHQHNGGLPNNNHSHSHSHAHHDMEAQAGHSHHGHSSHPTGPVAVAESSEGFKRHSQPAAIVMPQEDHTHACLDNHSENWVNVNNTKLGSIKDQVMAYMFELGCIFHSFIIGLTLGVGSTSRSEVVALLIALTVHQVLEGLSLGSVVMRAQFSLLKGFLMVLTYSITCPVGVAIGIGISSTYDGESTKSKVIQGTFNGVSAGMLVYIGLVQLIAEDFSKTAMRGKSWLVRLACYLAVLGGMASMAVLAMWA